MRKSLNRNHARRRKVTLNYPLSLRDVESFTTSDGRVEFGTGRNSETPRVRFYPTVDCENRRSRKSHRKSVQHCKMERLMCWTPLVVLAVFLCHLQTSTACSCIYQHTQTKVCESAFVALVTIEEFATSNETRGTASYKVHVNETFKATPAAQIALEEKPVRLWTSSDSAACGLMGLRPGETWVVGGDMSGGKLRVVSCGLAMPWSNLPPRQHENFRQFYQDACACQISFRSDKSADNKGCYIEEMPNPQESNCQERYETCMLGSAGCSWTPCAKTA